MICPRCGEVIRENDSVCRNCGYSNFEITNKENITKSKNEKVSESQENRKQINYLLYTKLSYLLSVIPIFMGFYKMFVYESGESYLTEPVNAYVGGDAYNLIINANYASAWFLLALMFIVLGSVFLICYEMKQ